MSAPGSHRPNAALIGPLAILLLLAVGALIVLGTDGAPREPRAVVETATPPTELARRPAPSVEVAIDYAADGVPFKPHDPRTPDPEGPMHPHPITPAHERIFRENNLVASLNGAMDSGDVPGLRKLLEEYRSAYPEDSHLLQQGYAVVADCLEHPGATSTAAARRYYDENKASTLRRHVRRHCFER